MMNEIKNELVEEMTVTQEIEEIRLEKVAGGVPILHPGHHYDPPKDEPDDNNGEAGGASGTW